MSVLNAKTGWNKLLDSADWIDGDTSGEAVEEQSSESEPLLSFFIPDLTVGGAEQVVVNIVNGLADRGHNVELVLSEQKGELLSQLAGSVSAVELSPKPYQPLGVAAHLPALAFYLRRKEPTALFPHLRPASVVAIAATELVGTDTAVVPTHHAASGISTSQTLKKRVVDHLVSLLYRRADRIIAVSDCVRKSLADNLPVTADSISTLYNPVDIESIQQRAQNPIEHEWVEDDGTPVVLFVGRIEEKKDLETWLQAFKQVHAEDPATRGIIVGQGPQHEYIQKCVDRIGISNVVDMPGYIEYPYRYMYKADVFLLSSETEGLPTVLIEALACGCPIVSTNCPCGPREILADGKYGHLTPTGDVDALATAVTATLSDPTDSERLRERAEDFSPTSVINDYEIFIQEYITG